MVQLLGLCPLLAMSNNVVNALSSGARHGAGHGRIERRGVGIRNFVPNEIRIPVFILIIAALVTVVRPG